MYITIYIDQCDLQLTFSFESLCGPLLFAMMRYDMKETVHIRYKNALII